MVDQATRLREIAEQHCSRPGTSTPRIITVTSGKGGVGKSVVAINLGFRLAELGNRTLLYDADANLGSIDVMAGISPRFRIADVIRGEKDIEDVLCSLSPNLSLLPGNSADVDYPRITRDKQNELLYDLAHLDKPFDYIIIDTSAGVGEDVIGFAVCSQETVVVTTPEPTALMDAYAIIKMIMHADTMVVVKCIVNSVRSTAEGDETAAKLQMAVKHFLHRDVHYLGAIPYDAHVSEAVIRQVPVVKEFRMSGASLSLQLIGDRICEQAATARTMRFQAT